MTKRKQFEVSCVRISKGELIEGKKVVAAPNWRLAAGAVATNKVVVTDVRELNPPDNKSEKSKKSIIGFSWMGTKDLKLVQIGMYLVFFSKNKPMAIGGRIFSDGILLDLWCIGFLLSWSGTIRMIKRLFSGKNGNIHKKE